MEIKYCKKCVTPNTRPRIEFDEEGICNACRYAEYKKTIDWKAKEEELRELVAQYKNEDGYDCIVPVSGGKDSHFQTYYAKEKLGLNPLCITFMPAMPNEIGNKNRRNMIEKLGIDHIAITPDPEVHRKLCRIMLIEHGNAFIPWIQGIYSGVTQIAVEKKIPLMFYGENGELEYGGATQSNASQSIESSEGIQLRVRSSRPNWKEPSEWHEYGFRKNKLLPYIEPSDEEKQKVGVKRLFLGDYVPWNNNYNLHVALNIVGGFNLLERRTVGTFTHGTSIDDDIDEIYLWFLWPKFGFHRASKSASPDIREGKLTRERAVDLVRRYDGEFPWYIFNKILDYLQMTEEEFWDVVAKFVGDKENIQRDEELAISEGIPKSAIPNRIPAWEKVGERKWRHLGTIHGEERILELPIERLDKFSGG